VDQQAEPASNNNAIELCRPCRCITTAITVATAHNVVPFYGYICSYTARSLPYAELYGLRNITAHASIKVPYTRQRMLIIECRQVV